MRSGRRKGIGKLGVYMLRVVVGSGHLRSNNNHQIFTMLPFLFFGFWN